MRLLSYINDQVFCWNDLLNVGTSDVWKYLNDKNLCKLFHEHHYVVITNLELSIEETNTIYICDPCIEFSYRELDNDKKISNIFHQNFLQLSTENVRENQFQVNECLPRQFAA